MISAEDAGGNLLPAIEEFLPVEGLHVLDVGTGTGRLPLLFSGRASMITGLDSHTAMLHENARQRNIAGGRWRLLLGDARRLPFTNAAFDLAAAGWVFGHFCGWHPHTWQQEISAAVQEMHRAVRPGGALVILETLGTGQWSPAPPTPALARYYDFLEGFWGFKRLEIRTDYRFTSVAEAVEHISFFFGQDLADEIIAQRWSLVPEWTGVWGKRV